MKRFAVLVVTVLGLMAGWAAPAEATHFRGRGVQQRGFRGPVRGPQRVFRGPVRPQRQTVAAAAVDVRAGGVRAQGGRLFVVVDLEITSLPESWSFNVPGFRCLGEKIMRLSSDYSNVDIDHDDWMNKTPYSDQVEEFCWSHLGKGPEFLVKRYEAQKDRVVKDTEIYTIYQLGNTNIQYRIRETSGLPGIIIDAIWKEEDEYEEGEI